MRQPILLTLLASSLIAPTLFSQTVLDEVVGTQFGGLLGQTVAYAGDYDGDGVDDYLVGAPRHDASGTDNGRCWIVSGATGGSIVFFTGSTPFGELGYALAGGGDLNNDGSCDIVIGEPGGSRIIAFAGPGTTSLGTLNGSAGARTGHALAFLGDPDGDGLNELAVGAPYADLSGLNDRGSVTIWEPGGSGVRQTIWGDDAFDLLGWSVGDAGDVNGDGDPDVVMGAPGHNATSPFPPFVFADVGEAHVYDVSSAASPALVWSRNGGFAEGSQFGYSVDGAGDVDGDVYGDVIIGAPFPDGRAFLYTQGPAATQTTLFEDQPLEWYGFAVAGVGDVDGDTYDDYAIGAPEHNIGSGPFSVLDAGRVELRSGWTGAVIDEIKGGLLSRLGWDVDGGGAVDGDLFGEFVVGAPEDDGVTTNGGKALLYTLKDDNASQATFGSGIPGTSGTPLVALLDDPVLGTTTTFELTSSSAVPQAAFLLLGLVPAQLPFKGGLLHLAPPFSQIAFTLGGTLAIPYDVPNDPQLACASIYWQLVIADPAAVQGFAMSPGLRLTYGF